jgi:hypothetical protein
MMCCTGGIMGNYYGNDANSNYNAVTAELNHRMSRGLQFRGAYTGSQAFNYDSDLFEVNPRYAY